MKGLATMATALFGATSISSHNARLFDPRMHMTLDELRALPGGVVDAPVPSHDADEALERKEAKRARRAARLGDVPVVINRKVKPKRKARKNVG